MNGCQVRAYECKVGTVFVLGVFLASASLECAEGSLVLFQTFAMPLQGVLLVEDGRLAAVAQASGAGITEPQGYTNGTCQQSCGTGGNESRLRGESPRMNEWAIRGRGQTA